MAAPALEQRQCWGFQLLLLELWVQPCTRVTSAPKGAVRRVNGAGSHQSFSPASTKCSSAPLHPGHSSTASEVKQVAYNSLSWWPWFNKNKLWSREGQAITNSAFYQWASKTLSCAGCCNCSGYLQGKYFKRKTSCSEEETPWAAKAAQDRDSWVL